MFWSAHASTTTMTASLSESASALNYGNRINFTVSVEGGREPYTYAWHLDNQLVENGSSRYYATDSQAVGSHHVYVQVTDADGNSDTTLAVEFNVLPAITSASPTQQSTASPTPIPSQQKGGFLNTGIPTEYIIAIIAVIAILIVVGTALFLRNRKATKPSNFP